MFSEGGKPRKRDPRVWSAQAFSEGGKRRKRDPDLSFEYGPSLAFAKNTAVSQSIYIGVGVASEVLQDFGEITTEPQNIFLHLKKECNKC